MQDITYHQAKTIQKTLNRLFDTYITVENGYENKICIEFNSSLYRTRATCLYEWLVSLNLDMSEIFYYRTSVPRKTPYVFISNFDYDAFLGLICIKYGTGCIIPGTVGLTEQDRQWYKEKWI